MQKFASVSFLLLSLVLISLPVRKTVWQGVIMSNTKQKPIIIREAPGITLRYLGADEHRAEANALLKVPDKFADLIRRYSIAIENTSASPVVAISIAYYFPRREEVNPRFPTIRQIATSAHFLNPSSPYSILDPGARIAYTLGGPLAETRRGALKGVGVGSGIAPSDQDDEAARYRKADDLRLRLERFDELLARGLQFELEIEGAVFADGTFAGTNRARFLEMNDAILAGFRALGDILRGIAARGGSFEEMRQEARQHLVDPSEFRKKFSTLADAQDSSEFNFAMAKFALAQRFLHIPESKARAMLELGVEHWKPLRWVKE